jgi:orotidine 5'-phosphate decarboxylase subfamily 2
MLLDIYRKTRDEKNSNLCVGLDPGVENFPQQSLSRNPGETLLNFCLDVIEKTSEYACAYKSNSQFLLFALNLEQLQELNRKIHDAGCFSILDHKLGDIGSSNLSALYWIERSGFDAFTFSPFAGNIHEATLAAHKTHLGLFVLTLMSNTESGWVQKESERKGVPLYREIASTVKRSGSDGVVIGATNNVTKWDVREIKNIVGDDTIFLCPGVGAQGGDAEFIISSLGENSLINVGRAIINDKNPAEKARKFQEQFNSYL